MRPERRSPWVVLGIPFPSDKATAKRAFARRAKAIRRGSPLPWTQEDLAWAEAEIVLAAEDPEASVNHYRIPADETAYERPREGELFVPAPRPLERRTGPSDLEALDSACKEELLTALKGLLIDLKPNPSHDLYLSTLIAETESPTR